MEPVTFFLGTLASLLATALIDSGKWALDRSEFKRTVEKTFYAPFDSLQESYPELVEQLFEEKFLSREDVEKELLVIFTTPDCTPSPAKLKELLIDEFPDLAKDETLDALLVDFISQVETAMYGEEIFHDILAKRDIYRTGKSVKKIDKNVEFIKENLPQTPSTTDVVEGKHHEIVEKIKAKAVDLLDWPQTLHNNKWIERSEYSKLLEWALPADNDNPPPIFLTGAPGSGKSALLSKLGNELSKQEVVLLALKADALPKSVTNLEKLTQHLNLPIPVLECFKALSKKTPIIILLDQLDALSELLTSDPGTLGVMTDLIHSLSKISSIKIICSCRTFEFNHDPRFSRIEATQIELAPFTWEQVDSTLASQGVTTEGWTDDFKELLTLPQHLNVFLTHLVNNDFGETISSYRNMLRKAWTQSIASVPNLRCGIAACEIAQYMGKQEVLWIEDIKFEDQYYHEIENLIKQNILVRKGDWEIGFRHQTIFDFARARAFVNQQSDLAKYITDNQASLFIRPILNSTLDFLRDMDRDSYHESLRNLWSHTDLQYHVKTLLMEFMGNQSQPDVLEFKLMTESTNLPELRSRALRNMSMGKGWYDLLESEVLPRLMTDEDEIADSVRPVLFSAFKHSPQKALALVETLWLSENRFLFEVFWMIVRQDSPLSLPSIRTLISIAGKEHIRSSFITNALELSVEQHPQEAGELLQTALYYRLDNATPQGHPSEAESNDSKKNDDEILQDYLSRQKRIRPWESLISSHDWYGLEEAISPSPETFAPILLAWLTDVLVHILWEENPRKTSYLEDHSLETSRDPEERPTSHIIGATRKAINAFATSLPQDFIQFVKAHESSEIMAVHRLLCDGLALIAKDHAASALEYLLGDPRRLAIGDTRLTTRHTLGLIVAVTPHLNPDQSKRLEDTISQWDVYPETHEDEPDIRLKRIRWNKEHRLALLDAFHFTSLSEQAQKLLKEARNENVPIRREAPPMKFGTVVSPMGVDQMKKAKDKDILGLFKKYDDDTKEDPNRFLVGGSLEASRTFERLAKEDPGRAISIMEHFEPTKQETPMGYGLSGLYESEKLDPTELVELIEVSFRKGFSSDSYRQNCLRVLANLAKNNKGLPDSICAELTNWIIPPTTIDTVEDAIEKVDDEGNEDSVLWGFSGSYSIPSGNYMVLEALTYGYICRETPDYNNWLLVLEHHLETDDNHDTIKALLYSELKWLINADHNRAENYVLTLEKKYPQAFTGEAGTTFLAYARRWLSDKALQYLLGKILESKWAKGAHAFGELVMLHHITSPENEWTAKQVEQILSADTNTPQAQSVLQGFAWSASGLWIDDKRYEQASETILTLLAPLVREQHARAMLNLFRTEREIKPNKSFRNLLGEYGKNSALMSRASRFYFLEKLSNIVNSMPGVVADVAEAVIDNLPDFPLPPGSKFHPDLEGLTRIGLALNRMLGYEEKGLKLFNKMLELEEYEAIQILNDLDKDKK